MRKTKESREDLQECLEKIYTILREYNSVIEFDGQIESVVIVDQDTDEFEPVSRFL